MRVPLFVAAALLVTCSAALAQESKPVPAPHTPAASQPPSDYVPTAEEKELIALSREWTDALRRKDERRLRELMAPDYTLQVWDASRAPQPLELWLTTLKTRLAVTEFEYEGLNARVFGDVGVVYARFVWKGALDGAPFTDSGFLADVWRKRDGKWQVVARRSAARQQIQKVLGRPNGHD